MIRFNFDAYYRKPLTQEDLYALARATTGLRFRIWQSYCDALSKIAEEYADEISQLASQFDLPNIIQHFRTKQRYERILPKALVEAIRNQVQPLI
jgi:hypothetical protein